MSAEPQVAILRKRLGWTQEQMAEYLGLDRSSVSRMENGQAAKGPVVRLLRRLSDQNQTITAIR